MQVAAPDRDDLRRLAELRLDTPVVLSLYLNLDPSEFATPPARATAIRSLLDEAERCVRERARRARARRRAALAAIARARPRPTSRARARRGRRAGRGGLRLRAGGPVRGRPAAARGRQPRGDRALAARRPAGAPGAARALVRRARQPPRRAHLPRLARRPARDRAGPRRRLRPAPAGRALAGAATSAASRRRRTTTSSTPPRCCWTTSSGGPFQRLVLGGPREVDRGLRVEAAPLPRRAGRRAGAGRRRERARPSRCSSARGPCFDELEEQREAEALERVDAGRARGRRARRDAARAERAARGGAAAGAELLDAGAFVPASAAGWVPTARTRCPADGTALARCDELADAMIELAIQQSAECCRCVTTRARSRSAAGSRRCCASDSSRARQHALAWRRMSEAAIEAQRPRTGVQEGPARGRRHRPASRGRARSTASSGPTARASRRPSTC